SPMRIAYLDCASGLSGDMTLGALIDAGAEFEQVAAGVASLGLPNCTLRTEVVKRKGFRATKLHVDTVPEKKHRHLKPILEMIERSGLSENQKGLAKRIFHKLAEAEAHAHDSTIEKVHFHEVGAVDSIADIVGTAIAWDLLGIERAFCAPIPVGSGFVDTEHGRLSVPAPAVAELLKNMPIAPSAVPFELTTPTGAAIVAALAPTFGPLPAMTIRRIGCGAGTRELPDQPNLLRVIVGETAETFAVETIVVLETTLDDAPGETIGFVSERLFAAGALDVHLTSVQMKKQRPGTTITVLSEPARAADLQAILFRETPTLGVRRWNAERTALPRSTARVTTEFGEIDGKVAEPPSRAPRFHPEYETCRRIAQERGVPLDVVQEAAQNAWRAAGRPS
ncbi:MAG TPA: nickel pincer cofactor biosynthesis protein LarC, partial [Pirellulales bacterium]